jgi:chromatin modification-related protein EAF6
MAENVPPKTGATNGDAAAGIPFYEKQRQHLKELITRKRALEKKIVRLRLPASSPAYSLEQT